jgi:AraC-like DNA-binding protein
VDTVKLKMAPRGSAPLDYLLHFRMRVAGNALRAGKRRVSAVALENGYRSQSAFSTAFKRIMGAPPKVFRAAAS